jgi:hypothetical protein
LVSNAQFLKIIFLFLCAGWLLISVATIQAAMKIPDGWPPAQASLVVTNDLNSPQKELIVETAEWKLIFSLFYNGGIYRLFDKVYDPNQQDNLVTGPWYCQGGIFDYDVYLLGDQEFMTTVGRNNEVSGASLEILENTPVRLRLRQKCHPRLNNGDGPPGNPFVELDMVEATTDWTFYATGRVYIKFDAVVASDWNGICSQGPGGAGNGISVSGTTVTAVNGTDFLVPWVTHGDTIESSIGGWGPVQINARTDRYTLQLASSVPSGTNLDFTIRRNNILDETFSIHADGDPEPEPHTSYWQGGSNGDPLYDNGTYGDMFRNPTPPVQDDYVYAHWTRPPRGYSSLLTFNETFTGATYAVFNDQSYGDLSYTQVARRGWRPFQEHHRRFMAQMGTVGAQVLPNIKSVADALPYADDYKHPYAQARIGTLLAGDGISIYGFHVPTGAYHIAADTNNTAAIAFDTARGGSVPSPLTYYQPTVLVSDFNCPDNRLSVELSQDNGSTFEKLPLSWYNVTCKADSSQLGAPNRRLLQLLCPIPAEAAGSNTWVLRFRINPCINGDINCNSYINLFDLALLAQRWLETDCGLCGGADLTGEGSVNIYDLYIITQNWLAD